MKPLTKPQLDGLAEAYRAKMHGDGWLIQRQCRIWSTAPMALWALRGKGLLDVIPQYGRARLTRKGRELVEADPKRFGLTIRAIAPHVSEAAKELPA